MIINPVEQLVAQRRCAGPCGKLVRVPVGLLRLNTWTCPACEYQAKADEVRSRFKVVSRFRALQKKHAWDLKGPEHNYPWNRSKADVG